MDSNHRRPKPPGLQPGAIAATRHSHEGLGGPSASIQLSRIKVAHRREELKSCEAQRGRNELNARLEGWKLLGRHDLIPWVALGLLVLRALFGAS